MQGRPPGRRPAGVAVKPVREGTRDDEEWDARHHRRRGDDRHEQAPPARQPGTGVAQHEGDRRGQVAELEDVTDAGPPGGRVPGFVEVPRDGAGGDEQTAPAVGARQVRREEGQPHRDEGHDGGPRDEDHGEAVAAHPRPRKRHLGHDRGGTEGDRDVPLTPAGTAGPDPAAGERRGRPGQLVESRAADRHGATGGGVQSAAMAESVNDQPSCRNASKSNSSKSSSCSVTAGNPGCSSW